MLREFKPEQQSSVGKSPDEIAKLIEKGDFKQAIRHCRQKGYQVERFSGSLRKMGRKMVHSRPGELASLIYKYKIDVGYDILFILSSQFNLKDYHGFLKNVYRYGVLPDFKPEVLTSIDSLNQEDEARSWRAKFPFAEA